MDYQATAEELGQHFHGCGEIARVTILCDKYTGQPKGWVGVVYHHDNQAFAFLGMVISSLQNQIALRMQLLWMSHYLEVVKLRCLLNNYFIT